MAWSSRQSTFGTTPADRLQLEADLRIGSRTAPLSWFGSGCPSILFGDDFRIDTEARGYLKRTRRTQKIKRAQRTRRTQKIRRTRRTRSRLEFFFSGKSIGSPPRRSPCSNMLPVPSEGSAHPLHGVIGSRSLHPFPTLHLFTKAPRISDLKRLPNLKIRRRTRSTATTLLAVPPTPRRGNAAAVLPASPALPAPSHRMAAASAAQQK